MSWWDGGGGRGWAPSKLGLIKTSDNVLGRITVLATVLLSLLQTTKGT